MDKDRLLRITIELFENNIGLHPNGITFDDGTIKNALEFLKEYQELQKWTRGCKYDCPYSRVP